DGTASVNSAGILVGLIPPTISIEERAKVTVAIIEIDAPSAGYSRGAVIMTTGTAVLVASPTTDAVLMGGPTGKRRTEVPDRSDTSTAGRVSVSSLSGNNR